MKSLLKLLVLSCLVAPFARPASAPASHEESLFVFENRKVTIAVPPGFGYVVNRDESGTYQVKVGDPKNRVSLDIIFLPDPDADFKNVRSRREMLFEQFGDYVDNSSEKGMQFEELNPQIGGGTYCVFTDTKLAGKTDLPPGEFLHLTAGVKAWPGVLAIFRLFSNETTSGEYQAAMKLLRDSVEERVVPLK